jgi:hypothetical protein
VKVTTVYEAVPTSNFRPTMAAVQVVPVPVAVPQFPLPMVAGQVPEAEMASVPVV